MVAGTPLLPRKTDVPGPATMPCQAKTCAPSSGPPIPFQGFLTISLVYVCGWVGGVWWSGSRLYADGGRQQMVGDMKQDYIPINYCPTGGRSLG